MTSQSASSIPYNVVGLIVDKIINKLVALNYDQLDLSIEEEYGDWV